MGEVTVGAAVLHVQCATMLVAMGVPTDDADLVAEILVEADLRGVHSHGANLMSLYATRLRAGDIRPDTEITIVGDRGSTVMLDGGLGLGQVIGVRAVDLSIERARVHGLAAVSVRELTHLGVLGFYTRRAAGAGCISMVVQNGPAFVPPYGGVTGLFSTNPFSYAIPAGSGEPVVFDIATTAVAGNRILVAKKRGDLEIPPGWANDREGRPTTDTEARLRAERLEPGVPLATALVSELDRIAGELSVPTLTTRLASCGAQADSGRRRWTDGSDQQGACK